MLACDSHERVTLRIARTARTTRTPGSTRGMEGPGFPFPSRPRNEPTAIGGVAWVVHKLHGTDDASFAQLTETVWRNTVELFALEELV